MVQKNNYKSLRKIFIQQFLLYHKNKIDTFYFIILFYNFILDIIKHKY